jgi:hypothetical protein
VCGRWMLSLQASAAASLHSTTRWRRQRSSDVVPHAVPCTIESVPYSAKPKCGAQQGPAAKHRLAHSMRFLHAKRTLAAISCCSCPKRMCLHAPFVLFVCWPGLLCWLADWFVAYSIRHFCQCTSSPWHVSATPCWPVRGCRAGPACFRLLGSCDNTAAGTCWLCPVPFMAFLSTRLRCCSLHIMCSDCLQTAAQHAAPLALMRMYIGQHVLKRQAQVSTSVCVGLLACCCQKHSVCYPLYRGGPVQLP